MHFVFDQEVKIKKGNFNASALQQNKEIFIVSPNKILLKGCRQHHDAFLRTIFSSGEHQSFKEHRRRWIFPFDCPGIVRFSMSVIKKKIYTETNLARDDEIADFVVVIRVPKNSYGLTNHWTDG
ncbi:unnamed protein product [Caenorhabditis angaria]|uniref:Uncharacterized protein n=1 Tax=Caenorhabditis angaria TaxID=860376 RepID=A0A9P1NBU1_9PELO|nr:unnamed protein product [Caenorhabditis angaria]